MDKNLGFKSLSHLSLFSRDLAKVKSFYCDILNFKIAHTFINKKKKIYGIFIIFNHGKIMLEFFLTKKKFKENQKYRHLCLEVKNIKKTELFFRKKGFNTKLSRGRTDKTLNFFVKDFENNVIEFHQYDLKSKLKTFLK